MSRLDRNLRFLLIIALLIPKNIKEQRNGEPKVIFHSKYAEKETAFTKQMVYHSLVVDIKRF